MSLHTITRISLKWLQWNAKGKENNQGIWCWKEASPQLSTCTGRGTQRGHGRLWMTNAAPAELAGWEGHQGCRAWQGQLCWPLSSAWWGRGVSGVFLKQNDVFNCFFPQKWKEPYATADPSEQNGCIRWLFLKQKKKKRKTVSKLFSVKSINWEILTFSSVCGECCNPVISISPDFFRGVFFLFCFLLVDIVCVVLRLGQLPTMCVYCQFETKDSSRTEKDVFLKIY